MALEQQIGDLRNQLNRMEQDRARLKLQMEEHKYEEDIRDRRKRQASEYMYIVQGSPQKII